MEIISEQREIEKIIHADHHDPFAILGIHPVQVDGERGVSIRAFLPEAAEASVVDSQNPNSAYPLSLIHPDGFFELFVQNREIFSYYIIIKMHCRILKKHVFDVKCIFIVDIVYC